MSIKSTRGRFSTDFFLADVLATDHTPVPANLQTAGVIKFDATPFEKNKLNLALWEDTWLTTDLVGGTSLILTLWLWNPNVGPPTTPPSDNAVPSGRWIPYKLNAGAAIPGAQANEFQILPLGAFCGKSALYVQTGTNVGAVTNANIYVRVREQ